MKRDRGEAHRFQFILQIMVENVRAVLGKDNLYIRDGAYSQHSAPPEINGETPAVFAMGGGVCIAADVALGEDIGDEMRRQVRIVKWVRDGMSRHYWVGIPISYPMTRQQEEWQDEGSITFHPFQI